MYQNLSAVLVAPRKFRLQKEFIERVPEDAVLVEHKVIGVCQGTDIHGPWLGKYAAGMEKYASKYPTYLGHQGAGDIVEVGCEVKDHEVGDRVFTEGGYRRYELIKPGEEGDGHFPIKIPSGVSYEAGSQATEIGATIFQVDKARIDSDDTVVIIGSGPMGILLLQQILLRSPELIIVTDLYEERLVYAKQFGADNVVDASMEDQVKKVLDLTHGGATAVFEAAGSSECIKLAIRMVRIEGRVSIFGSHRTTPLDNLDIREMKNRSASLLTHFTATAGWNRYARKGMKLLEHKAIRVDPLVSHRFELESIQQAYETIEKSPREIMKVMIIP